MKKMRSALALLAGLPLLGCAIHQKVQPVSELNEAQVCVVENSNVRPGFLEAYRKALVNKGFEVRMLPASASLTSCPITSTYSANWRWDLAMYMAAADIQIYRDGRPVGNAHYDSLHGGANMGKFIDADKKIVELVNQLFPGGARRMPG